MSAAEYWSTATIEQGTDQDRHNPPTSQGDHSHVDTTGQNPGNAIDASSRSDVSDGELYPPNDYWHGTTTEEDRWYGSSTEEESDSADSELYNPPTPPA